MEKLPPPVPPEEIIRRIRANESDRFQAVSDSSEYSVYDSKMNRDLFPTASGNRAYQCKRCNEETAEQIALALNVYHLTMRENACYDSGDVATARACRAEVFRLCFGKVGTCDHKWQWHATGAGMGHYCGECDTFKPYAPPISDDSDKPDSLENVIGDSRQPDTH